MIDCNKPTREKIKLAIGHIQNGKAAAPDGIPAEAIKGDVNTSVKMLYSLFEEIWEKDRMKGEVDNTLREEQAGFRQDRSCTDQIATLRTIVEQSIEWIRQLCCQQKSL